MNEDHHKRDMLMPQIGKTVTSALLKVIEVIHDTVVNNVNCPNLFVKI